MTSAELQPLIRDVSNVYQLPAGLLLAQVMVESSGDPWAFRYEHAFFQQYILHNTDAKAAAYGPLAACSYGLLQILLETACEIGYADKPERLFIPQVGLAFGAKKMRALWNWAGGAPTDYYQALCAYNGGTGGNSVRPFRNAAYADKVYAQVSRIVA